VGFLQGAAIDNEKEAKISNHNNETRRCQRTVTAAHNQTAEPQPITTKHWLQHTLE
jgi:hypothetical protein